MRWQGLAIMMLLSGCEQAPSATAVRGPGSSSPSPVEGSTPGGRSSAGQSVAQAPGVLPASAPDEEALALPVWSARSATGHAEVRQVVVRDVRGEHCVSTATTLTSSPEEGSGVIWRWETCLATQTQVPFVSEDGKRVLVVDPSPVLPTGGWQLAEVATLYEHGVSIRIVRAGAILATPHLLREPTPALSWLKGLSGLPGAPPRYSSNGDTVELETVEGHTLRWSFSGEGFPKAPEDAQAFVASEGMYRYEDDHKTMHFVRTREEVPAPYRSRAVSVQSQVAVVKTPPLPKGPKAPAPATSADKGPAQPAPQAPPKSALATPAELLQRTRDTVKQANETQRELQRQVDAVRDDAPAASSIQ